jgi:hypothetical protein
MQIDLHRGHPLARNILRSAAVAGSIAQLCLAILAFSRGFSGLYLFAALIIVGLDALYRYASNSLKHGGYFADPMWLGLLWGYAVKYFLLIDAQYLSSIDLPIIESARIDLSGADSLLRGIVATMATSGVVLVFMGRLIDGAWRCSPDLKVPEPSIPRLRRAAVLILVGGYLAWAISSWLTMRYGVAIGGVAENAVQLPFRLAGVIYWMRALVLPIVIGAIAIVAVVNRSRRIAVGAVSLLILHGVSMGFVNSSRGAIVYAVLPAAFMWMFCGTIRLRHLVLFFGILVFVGVAHPYLTELRYIRGGENSHLAAIAAEAFKATEADTHTEAASTRIAEGMATVLGRYVGAEGALYAYSKPIGFHPFENYVKYFSGGALEFSWKFTAEFAGYGYEALYSGAAPSLVGSAYIAAGIVGPPILVPLFFTVFGVGIAQTLKAKMFLARPFAAALTMICFTELGEGMISHLPERLIYSFSIVWILSYTISSQTRDGPRRGANLS